LGDQLCWFFAYRPAHLPTIIGFPGRAASRDRAALEARLKELGSRVLPAPDEPDVVRVADNNSIIVEVRVAE